MYVCMHVYSILKEKLKRLKKLSNRDREKAGGLKCLFGCNGKTAGGGGPALDRAWMGIIYKTVLAKGKGEGSLESWMWIGDIGPRAPYSSLPKHAVKAADYK